METDRNAEQRQTTTGASSAPMTQAARMRAAIAQAVAIAPRFLRGDVNADLMANTMVDAVRTYVEQERAAGSDGTPQGADAQALPDFRSVQGEYSSERRRRL